MFNAKILKEIQKAQNSHNNNVTSNVITMAHSSCAAIEYEVSDCKIRVSFIFEVVFLNIFVASLIFNICDCIFSELSLETLSSIEISFVCCT